MHGGEKSNIESSNIRSINCEKQQIIILLKGDSQGSIALAYNPVFYSKRKHIDI